MHAHPAEPAFSNEICFDGAGTPFRSLTHAEVAELERHAKTLDPDELLHGHEDLVDQKTGLNLNPREDCKHCAGARSRLDDLHVHWDRQHPLLRAALELQGLQPRGSA